MTVRVNVGSEICFLDVGQGDGIFIRTEAGSGYFIDGGSSSEKEIGTYTIAPFLKSKGVRQIEAWVITHPDADHCNGLEDVLENGYVNRVERILMPAVTKGYTNDGGVDEGDENDGYLEIVNLAKEHDIPVYYLSSGMEWTDDDAKFLCLNPPAVQMEKMTSNEYSVVLYLELGGYSFLLTGDAEGEGEEYLTEELRYHGISHVDVLKVAHHGSRNSTSEKFLEVLEADLAVISCGGNNLYGHPHEETIERLKRDGSMVYRIDESGYLSIRR